ncbi:MAG: DUF1992 domain-containing protein [Lachnospiraceae bacterium]|nr:DUF1992 domain-containing protein [Lachnospiraceae bacterium]MBF1030410.1 DUF1992 domain-containing protein [Lachnospiraceae bacterium]MBF1040512.1 DUF1992 domain-containing protein [Lachnospiraceae bacterium]
MAAAERGRFDDLQGQRGKDLPSGKQRRHPFQEADGFPEKGAGAVEGRICLRQDVVPRRRLSVL